VSVEISHPDKLLFPADGLSKADIADYYETVAEWMLPHVRDRPLSLMVFPDGIDGQGFFQKNTPRHYPDWIKRVEAEKRGGTVNHAVISNADTLVYLVGQNAITPHVWLSRADRLRQPDRVVFDLDPAPGADFAAVRRAARRTGDLLREVGLEPFAQVTGSKGIHVWSPLRRRATFEEVKPFARAAAELLANRYPDELTTEFRKAERGGRILVDVLRNAYAQTAVPPYAVRPRPGAPVATPVAWDELSDSKLRADRWTVSNVLRRLNAKGDPWADIASFARGLSRSRKRLEALLSRCSRGHQTVVRPATAALRSRVPQRGQRAVRASRAPVSQPSAGGTRPVGSESRTTSSMACQSRSRRRLDSSLTLRRGSTRARQATSSTIKLPSPAISVWSIRVCLTVPRRLASSSAKRSRSTSVASGPSGPVTCSRLCLHNHTPPNLRMLR
jgi:bifunctional non-homologous end joining protein LigD